VEELLGQRNCPRMMQRDKDEYGKQRDTIQKETD
jgi:hypothetical protein